MAIRPFIFLFSLVVIQSLCWLREYYAAIGKAKNTTAQHGFLLEAICLIHICAKKWGTIRLPIFIVFIKYYGR